MCLTDYSGKKGGALTFSTHYLTSSNSFYILRTKCTTPCNVEIISITGFISSLQHMLGLPLHSGGVTVPLLLGHHIKGSDSVENTRVWDCGCSRWWQSIVVNPHQDTQELCQTNCTHSPCKVNLCQQRVRFPWQESLCSRDLLPLPTGWCLVVVVHKVENRFYLSGRLITNNA